MIAEILREIQQKHNKIVIATRPPKADDGNSNIFMGIGIAQRRKGVAPGLGLGTIAMAVSATEAAAAFRKRGKPSEIHVLLADGHAQRFSADKQTIQKIADREESIIQKLFGVFGESAHIIRSSDASQWPLSPESRTYEELEADDIDRAHGVLQAGVKVGWQSKRHPVAGRPRNDEKHFDQFALEHKPGTRNLGFLRTGDGLRIDKDKEGKHQLVPPYIGSDDLAIGQEIPDVRRRLKELGVGSDFHNWLVNIGNAITRLEGRSPNTVDPWEQIQRIIDACTK